MPEPPKLTVAGKIVVVLFILGCVGGAYYLFFMRTGPAPTPQPAPTQTQPAPSAQPAEAVEIGIAYGTEKGRWLKWAVERFSGTEAGRRIQVDLIPMGSQEGAKAVVAGDERIHVWAPASSLYEDVFLREWELKHSSKPFTKEEDLALTPMVFVMWEERYDAFVKKYGELNFKTIGEALAEAGGWDAIAGKPEWGLFKFGHTNPNKSNSGIMALVIMAYDFHGTCKDLTMKNILDVSFQNWMRSIESGVSGLVHSTGVMMKDMVLKGPSTYDAILVYESVAIDYLKNAEGRWGTLKVVYPARNAWNENPYYILDVPWSSDEQRRAAAEFLEFLLTEPIQRQSLTHGFRPGNPQVPIKFPESPFVKYEKYGLKIDISRVCEMPEAGVINNLIGSWLRSRSPR